MPEVLIRVLNPLVDLVPISICRRSWVGISNFPKVVDELVALFIRTKVQERTLLFVSDQVGGIPVKPLLIPDWELLHVFGSGREEYPSQKNLDEQETGNY